MSVRIGLAAIACSCSFQTSGDVQQDVAAPTSAAEARPASQNRPLTGGERTASQNQDSQAAVVGTVGQPTGEKQGVQATGKDGPSSRCSVAEEKLASRPAAGVGTESRPDSGKGRPASTVAEKVASQETPSSSKQRHRDAQQDQ